MAALSGSHGQLLFLRGDYTVPLSALFDVKVGAVSGADDVFVHPKGNSIICLFNDHRYGQDAKGVLRDQE